MTLPEQIILADFAHDADAMVSPANSFGIMDGGIDAAIRRELGTTIGTTARRRNPFDQLLSSHPR